MQTNENKYIMAKLIHTWTFDHFNFYCEENVYGQKYLESSTFSPLKFDNDLFQFHLRLYPQGKNRNSNFVSLYLNLKSHLKNIIKANVKFSAKFENCLDFCEGIFDF